MTNRFSKKKPKRRKTKGGKNPNQYGGYKPRSNNETYDTFVKPLNIKTNQHNNNSENIDDTNSTDLARQDINYKPDPHATDFNKANEDISFFFFEFIEICKNYIKYKDQIDKKISSDWLNYIKACVNMTDNEKTIEYLNKILNIESGKNNPTCDENNFNDITNYTLCMDDTEYIHKEDCYKNSYTPEDKIRGICINYTRYLSTGYGIPNVEKTWFKQSNVESKKYTSQKYDKEEVTNIIENLLNTAYMFVKTENDTTGTQYHAPIKSAGGEIVICDQRTSNSDINSICNNPDYNYLYVEFIHFLIKNKIIYNINQKLTNESIKRILTYKNGTSILGQIHKLFDELQMLNKKNKDKDIDNKSYKACILFENNNCKHVINDIGKKIKQDIDLKSFSYYKFVKGRKIEEIDTRKGSLVGGGAGDNTEEDEEDNEEDEEDNNEEDEEEEEEEENSSGTRSPSRFTVPTSAVPTPAVPTPAAVAPAVPAQPIESPINTFIQTNLAPTVQSVINVPAHQKSVPQSHQDLIKTMKSVHNELSLLDFDALLQKASAATVSGLATKMSALSDIMAMLKEMT